MITTFRKNAALARLLPWRKETGERVRELVCTERQFQFELEKERSRAERRIETMQFSMLLLDVPSAESLTSELLDELYQRLRITDCMGWFEKGFAVLLPETGREGAERVAATLDEIGLKSGLELNPQILVYPEDDFLAATSFELTAKMFEDDWRDGEPPANYFDGGNGSSGKPSNPDDFLTSLPTPLWKRMIDVFGSVFGIVALSPVFVVAGIAVWSTSRGPVFFKQLREGKDGRKFNIFKFRTMCNDAEAMKKSLRDQSEQDGPAFKLAQDPRLTAVGKYLRRSCIDELPQLINVLKGDMSLVGPRPLPVDESTECEVWQRRRLIVLPGITCVWQARGDRNIKFSDWMRMDMEYLEKRSFLFDLKLIMETIFAVILHRGSV